MLVPIFLDFHTNSPNTNPPMKAPVPSSPSYKNLTNNPNITIYGIYVNNGIWQFMFAIFHLYIDESVQYDLFFEFL